MRRIFFLIRSLDAGGAERQLIELVSGLDRRRLTVTVATFYDGGLLSKELAQLDGVTLISLHKRGRWDVLPFLLRLYLAARRAQPDIVHGYLSIANELALFMGKLLGARTVWGLRSSHVDFSRYDSLTWLAFRAGAWLSRFPDLIIVNSWAGQRHHIAHGYCGKRMAVIPNGIDTERYQPDAQGRACVRAEWGIPQQDLVIGLVGRLDPMKDHPNFLRAAAQISRQCAAARFVCVGDGPEAHRRELSDLCRSLRIENRVLWAGGRSDMPRVYSAMDILVSASSGEGFSNVVAEAMACGVPCVVTDVGDSAKIVGETGVAVRPRDPEALANGILTAIDRRSNPNIPQQARQRIVQKFNRRRMADSTAELLEGLR